MTESPESPEPIEPPCVPCPTRWRWIEVALLMGFFFAYAGDPPPMVNEAHYLVKAKHFWNPQWCGQDLFASSGKAHATFYAVFGWPTLWLALETTAWLGRVVGWFLLALGLQKLSWRLIPRPLAAVGVAAVWIGGVDFANLAGEWVVGGIEAKIPAYGLVLLALAAMVQRRWNAVWPLLGAASAFHVLVGGWSVVAAAVSWSMTERKRPDAIPLLSPSLWIGGALSLFGLVPALYLTLGVGDEASADAARTYTYFRLPHHLLPAALHPDWYLRHGTLVLVTASLWVWCERRFSGEPWRRIGWYAAAAVGLAAAGLLIGLLPAVTPDLAARLLRYYWFRLTDFAVPLLFGLLVMRLLASGVWWPKPVRVAAAAILCGAAILLGANIYHSIRLGIPPSVSNRLLGWDADAPPATQRAVFADWLAVCRWARAATPPDEVFLTPRHQQTFKWYAGRAEVVNWKDVPQDAASLRDWSRRFAEVFPRRLGTLRVTIRYDRLREFRQAYGVRYMIVDRRVVGDHLPLVRVYPRGGDRNQTYAVYRIPE